MQGQEGSWGVSEQGWVSNGLLGAQAPPEIRKGQGSLPALGAMLSAALLSSGPLWGFQHPYRGWRGWAGSQRDGMGWEGLGWDGIESMVPQPQGCSEPGCSFFCSPPPFGWGALAATWPFPLQHPPLLSSPPRFAPCFFFFFSSGNIWKLSEKH